MVAPVSQQGHSHIPPAGGSHTLPLSLRSGPMAEMPATAFTPPPPEPTVIPIVMPPAADQSLPSTNHDPTTSIQPSIDPVSTASASAGQAFPSDRSTSPSSTTMSRATGSELQALQADHAKVKEEIARLSRLQELSDLERKLASRIEEERANEEGG
jgi:hypothetical protein